MTGFFRRTRTEEAAAGEVVHAPVRGLSVTPARASGDRLVVGIGECTVTDRPDDVLVTHALGSCIAVCIHDPATHVAGLLHFLLPDSRINMVRAREQPAAFADTGIPALFQMAGELGLQKSRTIVRLAGGAEIGGTGAAFDIGRRNLVAARSLLWRWGVLIKAEAVGGRAVRTVTLSVKDGRMQVATGRQHVEEL